MILTPSLFLHLLPLYHSLSDGESISPQSCCCQRRGSRSWNRHESCFLVSGSILFTSDRESGVAPPFSVLLFFYDSETCPLLLLDRLPPRLFRKLGISIRVPVGDSSTSSIDSIFESLTQDESETLKAKLQEEEEEELEALEKFRQTEEDPSSITKRTQKVFSNSDSSSTSSEYSSNQGSTPNLVTFSSLLPNNQSTFGYSPVLSPVGGQIVYVRPYEIPIAPISGPGKSLNNEKGLVIQIRDEFSFVYQIFGVSPLRIAIKEGQVIEKGQFLGGISKRPLTDTPLSRRKPADLPKNVRDSPRKARYYPFRFRELRLNVARPNPEWKEWREPFAKGWQYYNPLNFLSRGSSSSKSRSGWRSNIPPYGNPNSIFFASPPKSKEEAISTNFVPNAFATSEDFLTPVLRGNVELITGFDSFFQTPGDQGDGLDGLAIHRMDWGLVRKLGNGEVRGEEKSGNGNDGSIMDRSCNVGEDEKVDWRFAFEHHKVSQKAEDDGVFSLTIQTIPSFVTIY